MNILNKNSSSGARALPDARCVNMATQVNAVNPGLMLSVWQECCLRDWKMNPRNNFGRVFSSARQTAGLMIYFFIFPVISRNILTDPSSSQPTSDDAYGATSLQSESPALSQSKPPEGTSNLPEPTDNHEHAAADGTEGSRSGNGSVVTAEQTEPGALGQKSTVRGGRRDQAKPGHADEM